MQANIQFFGPAPNQQTPMNMQQPTQPMPNMRNQPQQAIPQSVNNSISIQIFLIFF